MSSLSPLKHDLAFIDDFINPMFISSLHLEMHMFHGDGGDGQRSNVNTYYRCNGAPIVVAGELSPRRNFFCLCAGGGCRCFGCGLRKVVTNELVSLKPGTNWYIPDV